MAIFQGCTPICPPKVNSPKVNLESVVVLARSGDFEGALRKNEIEMGMYPTGINDKALFQRAILLVHPENPNRNHDKAVDTFKQLKINFPKSPLNLEADAWLQTLSTMQRDQQIIADMKAKNKAQNDTIRQLNAKNAVQASTMTNQLEAIKILEVQLDKLKKIDLGIELEKRKTVKP